MDENVARAATVDDLKMVIAALNEHGVRYLLVGGYALAALGHLRATVDIDLLVPADPVEGEKLKRALLVLPDRAAADIEVEWFSEGESIRVADVFVIDILFNAGGETYESLEACTETADLGGVPVRTVSAEGLLRTKQTVRAKDVADRLLLERVVASRASGTK